jgi:hypothetical protein
MGKGVEVRHAWESQVLSSAQRTCCEDLISVCDIHKQVSNRELDDLGIACFV